MGKQITANTASIRSKAEELHTKNGNLKKQIDNLVNQENSLNSMWSGDANDEFHKAFNSDITQMNNFYNAIEQYVSKLQEIANKYDAAEKKNAQIAQQRKYK
jgi:WXG100 family type VII secretion target